MVYVKVCGFLSSEDAVACVALGVRAIGLNFVASSPRVVDVATARAISRAVGGKALVVGVVANLSVDAMRGLVHDAELGCLQLHGDETQETLGALLPHAYKAVRVATSADVALARAFAGEHLLVDAKVDGMLGGSGATFDWDLVKTLARERQLTLAGGLDPDNVARAVREVRPYCVDVASGVEKTGMPGRKDLEKVRRFVDNARRG